MWRKRDLLGAGLIVGLASFTLLGFGMASGIVSPEPYAGPYQVFIPEVLRPKSTATRTSTPRPGTTSTATATRLPSSTATARPAASGTPTGLPTVPATPSVVPSQVTPPTPVPTGLPTAVPTTPANNNPLLETFEGLESSWKVARETSGSASVTRSTALSKEGSSSALAATSQSGAKALVRVGFSDAAAAHIWMERPGSWFWQRTAVYVPSATLQALGANQYLTLAGLYPSAGGTYGWWLRVRQGGELYVYGYNADGAAKEFQVYGRLPADQWVELSLGLHSQNGPGVKRAFAFLVNGSFYGWYHQGHMASETYDRAAVGILDSNVGGALQVYVDNWRTPGSTQLPEGPDNRSTANLQQQDYRTLSGESWQIDWSTWGNDLRMDSIQGLYSAADRLQSGRNLERMPELASGWAEIEIGWPAGTPQAAPNGYFGPMVGFRKEINREENFEVIPFGNGDGTVDLVLEAWVNGAPLKKGAWALPTAAALASHVPEAGDVIRVRWQQAGSDLSIQASYFDASANTWQNNVISATLNVQNVDGINFNDGYHLASSITIDSTQYSIRRFKVGTIDTAP